MTATWTRSAITDLGPTTDVETAASVLSVSPWLAYELIRRDQFPIRVLRLGRRIRIPTHDLIRLLYAPENSAAGPATGPATALVQEDTTNDHTLPLRATR